MNWKATIGLITALLLTSCSKEDVLYVPLNGPTDTSVIGKGLKDPENNVLKNFDRPDTKATITPMWVEGDLITVYSIEEGNVIGFIDTCAVYDVGKVTFHKGQNNYARITAEVLEDCEGYFAAYPYNIFSYKKGDVISFPTDKNFGGTVVINQDILDGTFGTASMMTSWCNWCDNDTDGRFNFHNRAALLEIDNIKSSDIPLHLTIANGVDIDIDTFTEPTLYYPITTATGQKNDISLRYHNLYTKTSKAKSAFQMGHIYPIDAASVRLTGIYITGPKAMKPSTEGRIYCYAVIGGVQTTELDLSRLCTWSINYANRAVIEQREDGLPGAWLKKEGAGDIIVTASYEGFTTTFTIKHGK